MATASPPSRRAIHRTLAFAGLAWASTLVAGRASAEAHVVGPGQESVILAMLGGESPVASCTLGNVDVPRDRIVANYACGTSAVRVTLTFPPQGCAAHCT